MNLCYRIFSLSTTTVGEIAEVRKWLKKNENVTKVSDDSTFMFTKEEDMVIFKLKFSDIVYISEPF